MQPYQVIIREIFAQSPSSPAHRITIPKKIVHYILNKDRATCLWLNNKKQLEISKYPIEYKKINGIFFKRILHTNGYSFSLNLPDRILHNLIEQNELPYFEDDYIRRLFLHNNVLNVIVNKENHLCCFFKYT